MTLCIDVIRIICSFLPKYKIKDKIREFIDTTKIVWYRLCRNHHPYAIEIIEKNLDKLDRNCWYYLNSNPYAIDLVCKFEKIIFYGLCQNPNKKAISIIEKNLNLLYWTDFQVLTKNPNALHLIDLNNFDNILSLCENPSNDTIKIIENIIDKLDSELEYKCWFPLSKNPNAIHIIEKELKRNPNSEKIKWFELCTNPNAVHLIENELKENPNSIKIYWSALSRNKNAIHLIEKEFDRDPRKICIYSLFRNPNAINLIEKVLDRIDSGDIDFDENFGNIWENPNIFEPIYNIELEIILSQL